MSWELANEPRRLDLSWVNRTACLLKQLAPKQLVTTGVEGNISSSNFSRDHNSPCIDYATFHLWVQNWGIYDPLNSTTTLPIAIDFARKYIDFHLLYRDKPVVLEEFGISRSVSSWEDGNQVFEVLTVSLGTTIIIAQTPVLPIVTPTIARSLNMLASIVCQWIFGPTVVKDVLECPTLIGLLVMTSLEIHLMNLKVGIPSTTPIKIHWTWSKNLRARLLPSDNHACPSFFFHSSLSLFFFIELRTVNPSCKRHCHRACRRHEVHQMPFLLAQTLTRFLCIVSSQWRYRICSYSKWRLCNSLLIRPRSWLFCWMNP